jgi:hypothetical protein
MFEKVMYNYELLNQFSVKKIIIIIIKKGKTSRRLKEEVFLRKSLDGGQEFFVGLSL